MTRRLTTFAAATVVLVTLLACKKKSEPVPVTTPAGSSGSSTTSPKPEEAEPENAYLTDLDFARVCNELPMKGAKEYDGASGRIHPTLVFARKSDTAKFEKEYNSAYDGWKTDEAKSYELVACVTATKSTKVKECVFDSKQPVHYLDIEDTSYQMTVLEAKTGKQVGTKNVDVKGDKECPMIHMFHDIRESQPAAFEQALMGWAKQYVAPKEGAKPGDGAESAKAPPKTEAAKSEPAKTPAKTEPAKTPAKTEPAKTPAKTEPAKTPPKTEPAKTPPKAPPKIPPKGGADTK